MTATRPLLDLWTPPQGAGRAVRALATTFVLDPEFFHRDCLARFAGVQTVDDGSGSAIASLAKVELAELLTETTVTVLADRSTAGDRSSLRWDLLHADAGSGLLHAKVAILIWENATRVLVGSANLTEAGYRRQVEIALAADLGPDCLFTPSVLTELADELEGYLDLVPGADRGVPAVRRAQATLAEFRRRTEAMGEPRQQGVLTVLAPARPGRQPLQLWERVWRGSRPLRAVQLSPFWDADDTAAIDAVAEHVTGRPAKDRRHIIATVVSPYGESVGEVLRDAVDEVRQLDLPADPLRTLHAKCLLLESDSWVSVMVGSSNHTRAGLGLGRRAHREINVWLGASTSGPYASALRQLVPLGRRLPPAPGPELSDTAVEDEMPELTPLPLGFQICRLRREDAQWKLLLCFDPAGDLPASWAVTGTAGQTVVSAAEWVREGRPAELVRTWTGQEPPGYLRVVWPVGEADWTVVADDRADLPIGISLGELTVRHLFAALESGRSLAGAERDRQILQDRGFISRELDPLRRHDASARLLRSGRTLVRVLDRLQQRLARAVDDAEALRARLASPLGPAFLARRIVEELIAGEQERPDAIFTLAELALAVGRTDWSVATERLGRTEVLAQVKDTVDRIAELARPQLITGDPLTRYAEAAFGEATRCLTA